MKVNRQCQICLCYRASTNTCARVFTCGTVYGAGKNDGLDCHFFQEDRVLKRQQQLLDDCMDLLGKLSKTVAELRGDSNVDTSV